MTDFSCLKTDDDSVASGDDSTDWEKEDERMKLQLLAAGNAEDTDDISEDDGPVNEVEEFMLMAGEDNEEAGNTIPPPALPEFETIRVALNRGTSVAVLKEIAAYLNLSGGAQKKEMLFNRLRDSPPVTKISETEFEYQRPKMGGSVGHQTKIPTWILLTPEDVEDSLVPPTRIMLSVRSGPIF